MTYRDHQAISRDLKKSAAWNAQQLNYKIESYRNQSLIIDGKLLLAVFLVLYPTVAYILTH